MTSTTVVVDEGSSQIKVVWPVDGELKAFMIKSRGSITIEQTQDGGVADNVYMVDDMEICIGDSVKDPIKTNSDHFQYSGLNRALVHHALREAGFAGQDVDLLVTLPVDTFYRANKREDKKLHMRKKVTNVNGLPLANINNVLVAPEAVPVLDSIRLNDNGELLEEYEDIDKVLIVDIGGTTTDITVVTGRNTIEGKISVKTGVFEIGRNLKTQLFNDPKIEARDPTDKTIDYALRTSEFRGADISTHVKAASAPVAAMILNAMTPLVPDPDEVDFICYVGGGAHLLADSLTTSYGGNTITHPNPEFAVALGLMKNELSHATTE